MGTPVRVVIEVGKKRCFASAIDWPGWSRSGKTEADAIEHLAEYANRYANAVGAKLPKSPTFEVVERVKGDATTDFGAPGTIAECQRDEPTKAERKKLAKLVNASWEFLGEVADTAPEVLTKGPRGGGRDTDAVVEHVENAEHAYARKLGVITRNNEDVRASIITALETGTAEKPATWPPNYAAMRIAWHVLDHAWEIQDRSE